MNTNKIRKIAMYATMLSTMAFSCSNSENASINNKTNSNYDNIETRLVTTQFTNEHNPNLILAEETKDKKTNKKISETINVYSQGNQYIQEKRINNIQKNTYTIKEYNSCGKLTNSKIIDYNENKTAYSTFSDTGDIEKIMVDVGNDGKYDLEISSQGIKIYNS